MKKLFLSLVITLAAATLWAKQEEFKRKINKDFAVSANASLSISNKYGNVNIIEGNEGKIVFKIEITGKGKNAEIAKQYAENVTVDFNASDSRVTAQTNIPSMKCSNCGITVNYAVIVPRSVSMNFDLKYGNLTLNNTPKPLAVSIKYGNINANEISDAKIDINYGNVKLSKCKKLLLNSAYGNFSSDYTGDVTVDMKYGNFDSDYIENATVDIKYGNFKTATAKSVKIESRYTNVRVNYLENSIVANLSYGELKINDIATGFSNITATGKYTNFILGLNDKHNFKAELSTSYGNIMSSGIKFNNNKEIASESKHELTGIAGTSSNPKAEVKISASYGNISFN
jgi:hypothetical protein